EPRAGIVVEETGLAVDEVADALVQVAVGVASGLAEQAVAQRGRQFVERRVAIGVVHTSYRRGGRKFAPLSELSGGRRAELPRTSAGGARCGGRRRAAAVRPCFAAPAANFEFADRRPGAAR